MAAPLTSYVSCFPLQEAILDKDTGLPLADGVVSFFQDAARTVPKNVYYQVGSPGNYDFAVLGVNGVVTLSSIGTFVDGSGSNVIPFLWPFVGDPVTSPSTTPQQYYIEVQSAAPNLVLQFTVQNWPPNVMESNSSGSGVNSFMVHTYTSGTATYAPTTGLVYAVIECMGGGGGGGGTANTANPGAVAGGGGGAGGYSRKTVTLANIGASQLVTVGGFGAGGAAGNNPGAAGNASSVGSLCVANGGSGGGVLSIQSGGTGATAGTGDIAGVGEYGQGGLGSSLNTFNLPTGAGGNTQWGAGGRPIDTNVMAGGDTGKAGQGYGSGGSGGASFDSGGAKGGGNGAPGFVIITEYISA